MIGGDQSYIPSVRIMNALGSNRNNAHFVFLLNGLNKIKVQVSLDTLPLDSIY
jgi:hypothetical protein